MEKINQINEMKKNMVEKLSYLPPYMRGVEMKKLVPLCLSNDGSNEDFAVNGEEGAWDPEA